jgi:peptidoglycan/xylan/chitin deacetylase (PgdA/CDA1 family)
VDVDRRRELDRWAEALEESEAAEVRAAGRAIRMLCVENDELERRLAALDSATAGDRNGAAAAAVASPRRPRRARTPPWRRILVALGVVGLLAAIVTLAARAARPDVVITGPTDDAAIGKSALSKLEFASSTADAEWVLNGTRVTPSREAGRSVWRPKDLADGEYTLVVRRSGRLLSGERTLRFTVDTRAPLLKLDAPATVRRGATTRVEGRVESGATVRRGAELVPLDEQGRFRLVVRQGTRRFVLTATDAAGNSSRWRVPVTVVPRLPAQPIRAVHVTSYGWANDELRRGVLELVRAKKINAVELDLKDEAGEVGWQSGVPLARSMGAQLDVYDLERATRQLHAMGLRVIGRVVCFRDPIHASAAWRAGRKNEVIQAPDGTPYAKYGGFTNFANATVRKYNIDLAVAAAKLGVDDILYDYVRRPDGPLDSMVFPGLTGTPERAIVEFLAESRAALAPTGAFVGASVFGVAATRPSEVAQDIPRMARQVDYIAPMLYPSHWGPGEYNVDDPNAQPYKIVRRSTADFVKQVSGSGARVVNWLQDFSLGRTYGPTEVRDQIRASRADGVDDFILWNAGVIYTSDALEPTARTPAAGERRAAPPTGAAMPTRLPDPTPVVPAGRKPSTQPLPGLAANELGQVPVVMHHMIRPDRVGDYDQTPAEFRAELEYLWRQGYAPVNVGDLAAGSLDVPAGTTPVAFTFDDATTYQIDFSASGDVKPNTAVGIMLDFARKHPGFVPHGTFYVNRLPFGSKASARRTLPWLVRHGFEIGNHTHDHIPLRQLSEDEARKQIATGADVIHEFLPGYRIRTFALPLGSLPTNARDAVSGSWGGTRYGPYAVLLVGANPAPSPFASTFDRTAIPRIRSSHARWNGEADYAFTYWMRYFERNPRARYVSDGDVRTITVQQGTSAEVAPPFRDRVRQR